MAAKKEKFVLTQDIVNTFAKWRTYTNTLEKKLTKLSGKIKAAMIAGAKCPEGGPAILVLTKFPGSPGGTPLVDWKQEFQNYLLKVYKGDVHKVESVFKRIEDAAPKSTPSEPSYRLTRELNPKFETAADVEKEWEKAAEAA
jgi:hypothetical protein